MPARHQTNNPQQRLAGQDCGGMAWERERAEIAAQLIHDGAGLERIRKLQELEEGRFGPVSQARLLFGEGAEGLLEAVDLELGKAFVGEGVGKAEGEFLYERGETCVLTMLCRVSLLTRRGRAGGS